MSLQHDIAAAQRRHGPIKDLRAKLVSEVTDQLAFETTAEHAVAMHIIAMDSALEGLCRIAAENEQGYALVKAELSDLSSNYFKISLLLSALRGEVKP